MPDSSPLLAVSDLAVSFDTPEGVVQAVRGISFSVERGKTLAIVGESGSGKSVTAHTVLGLVRRARTSGTVSFDGRELLTMPPKELRRVRGARIAMIFQNPHSSLHPMHRIGWQIEEVIRIHDRDGSNDTRARAIELLDRVGIPNAARRVDDYPHEFSGGMLQRAMIAMAIALNPALLIADEPTTALDVTVQLQILQLLGQLQRDMGMAMVFITHDLGVVAKVADHVMVMYAGRTMEYADRDTLLHHPHHPYTLGLMRSLPRADSGARLIPIRGQPPAAIDPPVGCPFHPRCEHAVTRCKADQPLVTVMDDERHRSACWLPPGATA
jgi:oligopeptide/dipeptide ABC transporter ATP-binding protein